MPARSPPQPHDDWGWLMESFTDCGKQDRLALHCAERSSSLSILSPQSQRGGSISKRWHLEINREVVPRRMINQREITQWSVGHPWPSSDQVEQDLLLSQAMCEIANEPLLGSELVLRGGTAFHKLFLPQPRRYSEDLDFVRMATGGIGDVMKRLTRLGQELGYKVNTKMGMYPKVFWKFSFASGLPGKIKIEINTFERSPMLPLVPHEHEVASSYCMVKANIPTFQVEELIATKLRALYQRSKGRDLYDLWLALTELTPRCRDGACRLPDIPTEKHFRRRNGRQPSLETARRPVLRRHEQPCKARRSAL